MLSYSEDLDRSKEAGREEFVGGLVEAADSGYGVFLAGLHITDHTVAPDVGDLDFKEVVTFFQQRLYVGGPERGFPEDTGGDAVDGKVCDVLHNTLIYEYPCVCGQHSRIDIYRCPVNGCAGEIFHDRVLLSCPGHQFRELLIGCAAVLLVEMHLPSGVYSLDRCRFDWFSDQCILVTELALC